MHILAKPERIASIPERYKKVYFFVTGFPAKLEDFLFDNRRIYDKMSPYFKISEVTKKYTFYSEWYCRRDRRSDKFDIKIQTRKKLVA